jgi:alpha-beta hydrolase superfamily lysophospholipase
MQVKQAGLSRGPALVSLIRHCTAGLLAVSLCTPAAAQETSPPVPSAAQPVAGEATFTVFIRGTDVGREQVNLARSGSQWIISSTGRVGDFTVNRFELKYTADWQPVELQLEATQGGKEGQKKLQLATSFAVTTAINEISQNGVTNSKTDQISARAVVLPNNMFAGYEALAARLATAQPGAEFPAYMVPNGEVKVVVKAITDEDVTTPAGIVKTRKFELAVQNVGSPFPMVVTIDDKSRLARLEVTASALTVVRNDLAGVAVRPLTARNPTDSDVTIPANGFTIAATLTKPAAVGRLRHPAIALVGGSGQVDRDSTVAGIPILSQLAGGLSQQGYIVLRYDKRGVGQSGGRPEAATQRDYADDLIAIVKWLAKRDDVDERKIAVVGHSEGGILGMLAAAREKKIGALVLIATSGTTGAELILEQQQRELDRLELGEDERARKIELQKQIQEAVVSGTGWDALPPEVRKQADSPWFRSLLLFDPASVMPRVKQPILIVQGNLDTEVPAHHAEKLADLARARKKGAGPVEVVHLPGVNHLLVPATTGAVAEYAQLKERTITPEVASTIDRWLKNHQ